MYETLRRYIPRSQKVTFPINASLLKNSAGPLMWLCEQFDCSVTLWQSAADSPVDISELVYARTLFPKNRIYYDLLPQTMSQFIKVADDNSSLTKGKLLVLKKNRSVEKQISIEMNYILVR